MRNLWLVVTMLLWAGAAQACGRCLPTVKPPGERCYNMQADSWCVSTCDASSCQCTEGQECGGGEDEPALAVGDGSPFDGLSRRRAMALCAVTRGCEMYASDQDGRQVVMRGPGEWGHVKGGFYR